MHFHICRPCGTVWGHEPGPELSKQEFDDEHTCQCCGTTKCFTKWSERGEAEAACASPELTPREIENANYEAMEAKYGETGARIMWSLGERT